MQMLTYRNRKGAERITCSTCTIPVGILAIAKDSHDFKGWVQWCGMFTDTEPPRKRRKRGTYSQYLVSAAITSVALRHASRVKLTVVRYAAKVPLGTAPVGDIHLASEWNWCGLVATGNPFLGGRARVVAVVIHVAEPKTATASACRKRMMRSNTHSLESC